MHTNFLLLIILPLCGNRVGLHTGLSKHLIICTTFNIPMNSKIFLFLEHHKMITWLILAPVKCFSGSGKNDQLHMWQQWFDFCLPLIFLGMVMGTLILFMQQKHYQNNLRLLRFVFSFDFWIGFQKNTLTMLKVLLWFMTSSSFFPVKKVLNPLKPLQN